MSAQGVALGTWRPINSSASQGRQCGRSEAMSQSLAKILLHIVFSTKERAPSLKNKPVREELFRYAAGTLQNINCPAIIVGGVEDHVHVLCLLSRTITVAKLVENIKTSTSKWIKTQGPGYRGFFWQGGYGAFSVSES